MKKHQKVKFLKNISLKKFFIKDVFRNQVYVSFIKYT
jgi:hypothetical protein